VARSGLEFRLTEGVLVFAIKWQSVRPLLVLPAVLRARWSEQNLQ